MFLTIATGAEADGAIGPKVVNQVDDRWIGKGVDITPLIVTHGVPGMLRHEDTWWNGEYFHMHHSTAYTIGHVDKELLKLNLQVLLCTVWILSHSDKGSIYKDISTRGQLFSINPYNLYLLLLDFYEVCSELHMARSV